MKECEIDQLWYTWSGSGVDGGPRGFRVRAASKGLSDLRRVRFAFIDRYLHYSLPRGADPSMVDPKDAPVCLAFYPELEDKLLVHKVYLGQDEIGRWGNFFTHVLAGLPKDFSARDAIRLWKSPVWQTHDALENRQSTELPLLSCDNLEPARQTFDFLVMEEQLRELISAYLAPNRLHQRVYITGTSEQIAGLIWGLVHSVPVSLLPSWFTFITYNPDMSTGRETIVGIPSGHELPPRVRPSLSFEYEPQQHQDEGVEKATLRYINFAVTCLIETMHEGATNGRSAQLERFIQQAEARNVNSVADFVSDFREVKAVPPPVSAVLTFVAPVPQAAASQTATVLAYLTSRVSITIFVLLLVSGIGLVVSGFIGSSILLFISQMLLITTLTCVAPTLLYWITKRRNRVGHVWLESFLFIGLLLLSGLWLFGVSSLGTWIFYAAVLILFIEIGSYAVEWQKEAALKRLAKGVSFKHIQADVKLIEMTFRQERVLYISVPLGVLIGAMVGLVQHQMPHAIILLCFQYILLLSSLVLLFFLIVGFRRMCNALYSTSQVSSPELIVKKREGIAWILEITVPVTPQARGQKALDLAHDVSDLRSIYKYDALHNTLLIVLFVTTVLYIHGVMMSYVWLILAVLAFAFVFSDLPYAMGQYVFREKVLEEYTGTEHAEQKKKLDEYAPLFPPLALFAALTTAATLGGFLFFLLNLFIQGGLLGK